MKARTMEIKEIENIIINGAKLLEKSVNNYFPEGSGQKTLPENNVTLHIGAAFLNNGFTLFAEHAFKDKKSDNPKEDKYFDLIALEPRNGIEIRIECSEFQSAGKLKKIWNDVYRIRRRFKLKDTKKKIYKTESYEDKFGILLAYSSNKNLIDWWENDSKEPPKRTNNTKNAKERIAIWEELKEFIRDNCSGSCLLDPQWSQDPGYEKLVLLYVIFKIKESKFN